VEGGVRVDVAFTDATLDLQGLRPGFTDHLGRLEEACGVRFARLSQVHGDEVVAVDQAPAPDQVPSADALVTTTPGVGLMVRAADCVPVVLADPVAGVVGAVHAGRGGMVLDVTTRAVEAMEARGATRGDLHAWVGPHVCGSCYEVPAAMRDEVCAVVPEAWAETSWGTPSVDVGRGVRTQLDRAGVEVVDVGGCTREEPALPSYRRDGAGSGRLAGLVWLS
jgi:YfiH family protein